MTYRNRHRNQDKSYNYIYVSVFVLLTLWLVASIYFKKNPAALLQDGYYLISGNQDKVSKTSDEWDSLLTVKENEIRILKDSITASKNKVPYQTAIVNTDQNALNLRSEPSLSSEIVVKIPNGNKVYILYYDDKELVLEGENGRWVKVKYTDFEGWVWSNYLTQ